MARFLRVRSVTSHSHSGSGVTDLKPSKAAKILPCDRVTDRSFSETPTMSERATDDRADPGIIKTAFSAAVEVCAQNGISEITLISSDKKSFPKYCCLNLPWRGGHQGTLRGANSKHR